MLNGQGMTWRDELVWIVFALAVASLLPGLQWLSAKQTESPALASPRSGTSHVRQALHESTAASWRDRGPADAREGACCACLRSCP